MGFYDSFPGIALKMTPVYANGLIEWDQNMYSEIPRRFYHFLLFVAFVHISKRPSFASESGKLLMAWAALVAYSSARARVCSRPSLRETISLAYRSLEMRGAAKVGYWNYTICTSPSPANFRPTSTPSSLCFLHAKSRGAVASPSSRSAPAGFPSSSPLMV